MGDVAFVGDAVGLAVLAGALGNVAVIRDVVVVAVLGQTGHEGAQVGHAVGVAVVHITAVGLVTQVDAADRVTTGFRHDRATVVPHAASAGRGLAVSGDLDPSGLGTTHSVAAQLVTKGVVDAVRALMGPAARRPDDHDDLAGAVEVDGIRAGAVSQGNSSQDQFTTHVYVDPTALPAIAPIIPHGDGMLTKLVLTARGNERIGMALGTSDEAAGAGQLEFDHALGHTL